jgi:hypothetical protein
MADPRKRASPAGLEPPQVRVKTETGGDGGSGGGSDGGGGGGGGGAAAVPVKVEVGFMKDGSGHPGVHDDQAASHSEADHALEGTPIARLMELVMKTFFEDQGGAKRRGGVGGCGAPGRRADVRPRASVVQKSINPL